MLISEFKKLVQHRFSKCTEMLLISKNKEYTRNNDKLHNFKEAGRLNTELPEKALFGMMIKQYVSIRDIIQDLEDDKLPTKAIVEEKISDLVNYFVLLEALLTERIDNA